jgi:hypothetical protein
VKADVKITASVSDRGVSKLAAMCTLAESVMQVQHCDVGNLRVEFTGTTELKLSELTAALYQNADGAKLIHNITYNAGAYLATNEADGLFSK